MSFLGEGSPTRKFYRKKSGTLIVTSLLEDLVVVSPDPLAEFEGATRSSNRRTLPGARLERAAVAYADEKAAKLEPRFGGAIAAGDYVAVGQNQWDPILG